MNLQAEKIELVRLILDTEDIDLIHTVKTLLIKRSNNANSDDLNNFYKNFKASMHEIKRSQEGESQLKNAKDWLNEL